MLGPILFKETRNGPFLVNKNDEWIRYGLETHDLINSELLKFNHLLQLASRARPSHTVVIDGGANMGSWSIPLARTNPNLTFHAFEVQRLLYNVTCGNIALNFLSNVYAHWAGLDAQRSIVELPVPNYMLEQNFGAYEVHEPDQNSDGKLVYSDRTDQVRMLAIDELGLDVLFIKLDIEGMELRALQGAQITLERQQPVVFCERHKCNEQQMLDFFVARNYATTLMIEGHWTFIPPWLYQSHMQAVADIFTLNTP